MRVFLVILFFLLIIAFCLLAVIKYYYMGISEPQGTHRNPNDVRRLRSDPIEITTTGGIPLVWADPDYPNGYVLYNPLTDKLTSYTVGKIDGIV